MPENSIICSLQCVLVLFFPFTVDFPITFKMKMIFTLKTYGMLDRIYPVLFYSVNVGFLIPKRRGRDKSMAHTTFKDNIFTVLVSFLLRIFKCYALYK